MKKKTLAVIAVIIVALIILVMALIISILNMRDRRIDREAPQVLTLLQKREDGHFYASWSRNHFTVTYPDGRTAEGYVAWNDEENIREHITEITENYVYFYTFFRV